jgi:glycosyltransferase involved in cell wall biosynthesis
LSMKGPKISVVIISYNQARFLEETILSVVEQGYHQKEVIVIDGGSTDGSFEIIQRYADRFDYWISESDKGSRMPLSRDLTGVPET